MLIIISLTTGGKFKLELFLTEDYPMVPPKIRFLTKIYHPNVDRLGRICLDVLKSKIYYIPSTTYLSTTTCHMMEYPARRLCY